MMALLYIKISQMKIINFIIGVTFIIWVLEDKMRIIILAIVFILFITPITSYQMDIANNSHNQKESNKIGIASATNGKTLYVGGSGPNNYTSIQDAINAANNGDTIFVYDDSSPYYGNIIINKSISLIGENRNTTIIEITEDFAYDYVIEVISDNVLISGFTIKGAYYGWDGINLYSSRNVITNNKIEGKANYGISVKEDRNRIVNNIFLNNSISVYLSSSRNIISNNFFIGGGIFVLSFPNRVTNNTVNELPILYLENITNTVIDEITGEIILINCSNVTIKNQKISKTFCGIQLLGTENCKIQNNVLWSCGYGIYLQNSSRNNISQNKLYSSISGIYMENVILNTIFDNNISSTQKINLYLTSGIEFYGFSLNNSIIKNRIRENYDGVISFSVDFEHNRFLNNIIENNENGLGIGGFSNIISNNILKNDFIDLSVGGNNNRILNNTFLGMGIDVWEGIHIIKNNTLKGKPILAFSNEKNKYIRGDAGQVILMGCQNFLIENITFLHANCPIQLLYTSFTTVRNCRFYISGAYTSISIYNSTNNTLLNNEIFGWNDAGIYLRNSNNNFVAYNLLENNGDGIVIESSKKNKIVSNEINNTTWNGIAIGEGVFNVLSGNVISNSKGSGIIMEEAIFNIISGNNIVSNKIGIEMDIIAFFDVIINNNFIYNEKNAFFWDAYFIIWLRNYWSDWRIPFPKPIFGFHGIFPGSLIGYPWIQFDFMPRLFPCKGERNVFP